MKLTFSPQARFDVITVVVSGNSIIINGEEFDLSKVQEDLEVFFESRWFAGPVRRIDGILHVPLIYPHGVLQTDVVPGVVDVDVEEGPVDVPRVDELGHATQPASAGFFMPKGRGDEPT